MNEKKDSTSRKKSLNCLILIVIIAGVCGLTSLFGESDDDGSINKAIDKSTEDGSNSAGKGSNQNEEIQQDVTLLFHLEDFNNKSIASLIEKYGEPSSHIINELPIFSHIIWDNENFNILLDYKKGENISHGGLFYLKKILCSEDNLDLEHLELVLKLVGIEFDASKWLVSGTGIKQIYATSVSGWENITLKCYQNGGYAYLNAGSEGYMDWAKQDM